MQSKTSCFNKTLFRKHVTRFWPVWTAYFGIWLLILPIGVLSERRSVAVNPLTVQTAVLNSAGGLGVVLPLVFAVLMAMGVWSFLYNARSASGAGCLPLTRTAQYWSAALGGLVPLAGVHVAIFVLTALAELSVGALHLPSLLTWLGVTVLTLLFFYGFATFCAMLTGNIIVLPAVYLVLNFTAAGVELLLNGLANCFLYGLNGSTWSGFADAMNWLSPAIPLLRFLQAGTDYMEDPVSGAMTPVSVHFEGAWVAGIYAAVGVLLLLAAWALLRRRRMESAGDVVAVGALKPVFRWCMGICGGLCFACAMLYVFDFTFTTQRAVFAAVAVYLVIGAFIGWFAAEMLIRRSFRAFTRGVRGWAGWALCCAVLLLGLTATELDLFGVERRQPKPAQIESAIVIADGEAALLTSPEGVAAALDVHRGIIEHKSAQDQTAQRIFFLPDYDAGEIVSVHVTYQLKNGGTLTRVYQLPHLPGASDDAAAVQALLNCPEAVRRRKETAVPFTPDNVRFGTVRAVMTAAECAAAAGYDDPADYVLCALGGYSPQEAKGMSDASRAAAVEKTLELQYSEFGGMYGYGYNYDGIIGYYEKQGRALPAPDATDWDGVWLEYTLTLSDAEAWALYHDCIVPDNADGTLGRVWVLHTEPDYAATVCAGTLEIVAERPEEPKRPALPEDYGPTVSDGYYSFTTTPTVDAARTNAFLAERGIRFHTSAEIWGE